MNAKMSRPLMFKQLLGWEDAAGEKFNTIRTVPIVVSCWRYTKKEVEKDHDVAKQAAKSASSPQILAGHKRRLATTGLVATRIMMHGSQSHIRYALDLISGLKDRGGGE